LYAIDVSKEENCEAIEEYLQSRKSTLDKETIKSNSFILGNSSNDIWF
jgi:hypothetical protein